MGFQPVCISQKLHGLEVHAKKRSRTLRQRATLRASNGSCSHRAGAQDFCSVHHWERAYWLIVDHPYATITNTQGEFAIEKFPTGAHELIFWHESYGYVSKLPVHVERDKPTLLKDIVAKELPPSKSP